MNTRLLALSAALAISHVAAAPLRAQETTLRPGFTLDVGLGGGLAGTRCSNCIAAQSQAPSGFVQVGRVVAPDLIVGVGYTGWAREQYGGHARYDFVLATAQWYPSPSVPVSFRLGAGYGHTSDVQTVFEPVRIERAGFAMQTAIQYDLRLSPHLIASPYVGVLSLRRGTARYDGSVADTPASAGMYQYGVSIGLR